MDEELLRECSATEDELLYFPTEEHEIICFSLSEPHEEPSTGIGVRSENVHSENVLDESILPLKPPSSASVVHSWLTTHLAEKEAVKKGTIDVADNGEISYHLSVETETKNFSMVLADELDETIPAGADPDELDETIPAADPSASACITFNVDEMLTPAVPDDTSSTLPTNDDEETSASTPTQSTNCIQLENYDICQICDLAPVISGLKPGFDTDDNYHIFLGPTPGVKYLKKLRSQRHRSYRLLRHCHGRVGKGNYMGQEMLVVTIWHPERARQQVAAAVMDLKMCGPAEFRHSETYTDSQYIDVQAFESDGVDIVARSLM